MNRQLFEKVLDSREPNEYCWEGDGDRRLNPYWGFKLKPTYETTFDIQVFAGRGNYDGGGFSKENATREECLQLFDKWCWE